MTTGIVGVFILMFRGMPIMIRGRFATTKNSHVKYETAERKNVLAFLRNNLT